MGTLRKSRGLVVIGLAILALTLIRPASAVPGRVYAGHGLSILIPAGAHLTEHRFTSCADPIERFSLIDGHAILTLEERLGPEPAPPRPARFRVTGPASPMECCAIAGRSGWVVHFRDHGRGFYAYLYPGGGSARPLLRILDSLRVESASAS